MVLKNLVLTEPLPNNAGGKTFMVWTSAIISVLVWGPCPLGWRTMGIRHLRWCFIMKSLVLSFDHSAARKRLTLLRAAFTPRTLQGTSAVPATGLLQTQRPESWCLIQPHKGRKEGGKFGSLLFQPREEAQTEESVFVARGSLSFLHCRIALGELSLSKALPPLASGRKISKGITHNFLCCNKLSHNFFFSKNKLWEKLPVLPVVWGRGEIIGNQYMTCSTKTDTAHTHTV